MSKKGKISIPQEDIAEPQIHDIHNQEVLLESAHLEKDLLSDEVSDDEELGEKDEFNLDHAMNPYE